MESPEVKILHEQLRSALLGSELAAHVDVLMNAAETQAILETSAEIPPLTDAEVDQVMREQPGIRPARVLHVVLENRRLAAEKALPIGASRFGFVPDLPPGLDWPTFEGKKFLFLAQINLAEMPCWEGNPLPSDGWLYVFGMFPERQTRERPWRSAVFYHRGSAEELVRATKPNLEEVWQFGNSDEATEWLVPLAPRLGIDIDRQRILDEDSDADGWLWDLYDVIKEVNARKTDAPGEPHGCGHLLGQVAVVDGTAASNVSDLMKSRVDAAAASFAQGPATPSDDWMCLLAIFSSGSMQWSDAGELYLLMRRSDLLARDFTRVCMSICSA